MRLTNETARELYQGLKLKPRRKPFGFGKKPILVNVDLQNAYTAIDEFSTAYQTDPKQIDYVNELAELFRKKSLPVVWTYVAYMESGEDCGIWGTRTNTPESLQNIKVGSRRAGLDDRLKVNTKSDIIINKLMASAFFETNLRSLMVWHDCDTIVLTGGATSGCIRATAVDGLSNGYRVIVPEECVSDSHEGPHFANLYDIAIKYADVIPVAEVLSYMSDYKNNGSASAGF